MPEPTTLLHEWIARQASEDGLAWLDEKTKALADGASDRVLFTSFSAVPRYLSKNDLQLTADDLRRADDARKGWSPAHWSVSQAARTLVVLSPPNDEANAYVQRLERMFDAADVGESVALYQALPLLPHPEQFVIRAAEGVRSNMTSVFNAVALRNPYPAEFFDEGAWNQMVLKAVFVGSPLYQIHGLDGRANPELARMLVEYAHERWSAGREVTPELWRPVGRFADSDLLLEALERAVQSGFDDQRESAALAVSESPSSRAQEILADHPELRERVDRGEISWPTYDPIAEENVAGNVSAP